MIARVVVCATLLTPLAAWSQAPEVDEVTRAKARKHLERAKMYYKLEEYAKALEEYRATYALVPLPDLLFNLGQAARLNGNVEMARDYYQQYLREKPTAANKDEVQEYVRSLTLLIEARNPRPQPDPAAALPLSEPPAAAPAPEPPAAAKPAPAGGDRAVTAVVAAPPPLPPPVPEPAPAAAVSASSGAPAPPTAEPMYEKWWFWAGVGMIVAGGATAAVLATASGPEIPATKLGTVKF